MSKHKKKPSPRRDIPIDFVAPLSECSVVPIEMTKAHFLDAYSKGKWNLSDVPRPVCLQGVNFMIPPECYHELNRVMIVDKYMNLKQWEEKSFFKKLIGSIKRSFEVGGVSISLITTEKVVFKYETTIEMNELPRELSIDSHAILSRDYLLLHDATKDWRTTNNPLVTGIPYIKFYCGVPLLTEKKEIIGILAIFDQFPKPEPNFTTKHIERLKGFSTEILTFLNKPIELKNSTKPLTFNENLIELNELQSKLGRATGRGSLMTVFEKDGSGGPYLQNNNFKFLTKLTNSENEEISNNKVLMDKLVRMGNIRRSSNLLCRILTVNYNIDYAYILEIRVAESYNIDSKYFPENVSKIDSENFDFTDKLIKNPKTSNDFMTRVIGNFGPKYSNMNYETAIHYKSFVSEFGIKYKNEHKNAMFNSGILIPFHRHNSKLVKQKRKGDSLEVSLRSGGYLIGLFREKLEDEFKDEEISRIFNNVSILRKIYI
ncbi:hypothetical protein CLIB1444_01S05446 [[Candida] jaroonii]|uniref:Uncharacterized protein n=1 Tax=[Candida] jaroonii TaxID=467808 RepID=A0ACA9Y0C7_9ASCO|nr:hypothetical protein CLIB1444_01S05446 [[Candida] jaroonii]